MSKLPRNSSATPYDSVSFRKVGWGKLLKFLLNVPPACPRQLKKKSFGLRDYLMLATNYSIFTDCALSTLGFRVLYLLRLNTLEIFRASEHSKTASEPRAASPL